MGLCTSAEDAGKVRFARSLLVPDDEVCLPAEVWIVIIRVLEAQSPPRYTIGFYDHCLDGGAGPNFSCLEVIDWVGA